MADHFGPVTYPAGPAQQVSDPGEGSDLGHPRDDAPIEDSPEGISLFIPPGDLPPSLRFMKRFNAVADQLGIPLRWFQDYQNPLAVDANELEILPDTLPLYGLSTTDDVTPPFYNEMLEADVRRVLEEVERQRLQLVEASYHANQRIPYRGPLERLNPVERAAVDIVENRLKPAINRIYARQEMPDAPRLAAWMTHNGDYSSRLLYDRFHNDVCAGGRYFRDPDCSLFPFYPDKPPINGMIDPGISEDDLKRLGRELPPNAEELRPTTTLTLDSQGRMVSTPLPRHPDFVRDHEEAASALEEMAALNIGGQQLDPALRVQCIKWARFFRTGTAEDEAAAAQATIDAGEGGGNLRLHVGPSESYWKDNIKFPYLLQLGIPDRDLQAQLARRGEVFLALERSLTGIPHYTPRHLSIRGGFVDPIHQIVTGGFIEGFPLREPLGNNFPNYDVYREFYHVEGGNRFILLEGLEIAAGQMKTALSRLLNRDVSNWDAVRYIILDVAHHESGHMIGPQRDHITPSGNRMAAIFGDHWGSADEPKADLTGPEVVRQLLQTNQITREEAANELLGTMAFSLSNRYKGLALFGTGGLTDHYYGHMIEAGQYFRTGAWRLLTTATGQRRIHIDLEHADLPLQAGDNLWRGIITFQAAGDLAGFLRSGSESVTAIPQEADRMILEANRDQQPFFIERHL